MPLTRKLTKQSKLDLEPLFLNIHDGAIGMYGAYFSSTYIAKFQRGSAICSAELAPLVRSICPEDEVLKRFTFVDVSSRKKRIKQYLTVAYLVTRRKALIHDLQGTLSRFGWIFWPYYYIFSKLVLTEHEPQPPEYSRPFYFPVAAFFRNRLAAMVIVLGEETRKDLVRKGIGDDWVSIEHGPFSHYRRENERALKTILFLGKFRSQKGFELLPGIAEFLYKNSPEVKLRIVGSHPGGGVGSQKTMWDMKVDAIIDQLADMPNVELRVGKLTEAEVADEVSSAGGILLPYRSAANSGVLAAAIGAGRAVVTTGVGELGRLVNAGGFGIATSVSEIELGAACCELLSTESLRIDMERNATLFGESVVSWELSAIKYSSVLKDILRC